MPYCPSCLEEFYDRDARACPECGAPLTLPEELTQTGVPAASGFTFSEIDKAKAEPKNAEPKNREVLPRSIGRFGVIRKLGSGGFGAVYLAHDPTLDRLVAIKVLRPGQPLTDDIVERFRREARSAAQLHHPGIVAIHSVEQEGDVPFIVCEYVDGMTLGTFATECQPSFHKIAEIVRDVALALEFAHSRDIVHRDVKPENILIDKKGAPRLADFGLARRINDIKMTAEGQILGTPAYMSPEQAGSQDKQIGPPSDIYSLGVVLYVLLTGEVPFRGKLPMVIKQVVKDVPRSPCSLNDTTPIDLETICQKAMEKEPHRRYASAQELADDLDRWLTNRPIRARHIGPIGKLIRWSKRNPLTATLVGTVASLVIGVASITSFLFVREYRLATEKLDMLNGLCISRATAYFDPQHPIGCANPLAALSWLTEAVAMDSRNPHRDTMDRIRLGYALRTSPAIVQMLFEDQPIRFASFDPAGKRVLTCGSGPFARIWDAETGAPMCPPLRHDQVVAHAAFSPDGLLVATCSADGTARIWNSRTGLPTTELLTRAVKEEEHPATSPVSQVIFSPNGKLLATMNRDRCVDLWEVKTGKSLCPTLVHKARTLQIDFSPDSTRLLTAAGAEGTAMVWDAATGRILSTFEGHTKPHAHVHVASFGGPNLAASGDTRGRVYLWSPMSGDVRAELPRHEAPVWALAFSPNGKVLVTGSTDGVIKLWNLVDSRPIGQTIGLRGRARIVFSPSGDIFATTTEDGLVAFWDTMTGKPAYPPLSHAGAVLSGAFDVGGSRFLTASTDGPARIWNCRPKPFAAYPHQVEISKAATSLDGAFVALGRDNHTLAFASTQNSLDAHILPGPAVNAQSVVFNKTGSGIAFCGGDGTARVWRTSDFQPAGPPLVHTSVPSQLALSDDTRRLVTLTIAGHALLWDTSSGAMLHSPVAHPGTVADIAISPNQGSFATAGSSAICFWNSETGDPIGEPLRVDGNVHSVCFGPLPGQFLATGDNGATVWQLSAYHHPKTVLECDSPVALARFSPDGQDVATVDRGGTVQIWKLEGGAPAVPAMHHRTPIAMACFSLDGRFFLTSTLDDSVRVWDAHTGTLVAPPVTIPERVYAITADASSSAIVCYGHHSFYVLPELVPDSRPLDLLVQLTALQCAHKLDRIAGPQDLDLNKLRDLWMSVRRHPLLGTQPRTDRGSARLSTWRLSQSGTALSQIPPPMETLSVSLSDP